ncbi:hypothetical protein Q9966_014613 [Columba livia]|nr:hypothetical protein Q9966_014613 [Columba livia]
MLEEDKIQLTEEKRWDKKCDVVLCAPRQACTPSTPSVSAAVSLPLASRCPCSCSPHPRQLCQQKSCSSRTLKLLKLSLLFQRKVWHGNTCIFKWTLTTVISAAS